MNRAATNVVSALVLHIMARRGMLLAHHRAAPLVAVVSASMERLCGRPGCSDPASVAYGMRPEDLVFWLDVPADDGRDDHGVLCGRHADSMVVPRGWTLDDLRDPELHLFRPPNPSERVRVGRSARPGPAPTPARQLRLDELGPERQAAAATTGNDTTANDGPANDATDEDAQRRDPWTPSFDEADDLDGLLSAQSPLLSRAFRTAERADG